MQRTELIDIVAKQTNLDKGVVEDVLDGTIKVITLAVAVDEEVVFRNFGKFHSTKRPARTARNPHTGGSVEVGEKRSIVFRPSSNLRERLNATPLS